MAVLPMILLLDTSGSMSGEKIKELNKGVKVYIKESKKILKKKSLDGFISIMTFDSEIKHIYFDGEEWISINEAKKIKIQSTDECTLLGEAIIKAISEMEKKLEEYRKIQETAKHPTLIIFTDGEPVGEKKEKLDEAIQQIKKHQYYWNIITIACGVENHDFLEKLSKLNSEFNNGEVIRAKNAKEIVQSLRYASSSLSTMRIINRGVDTSDAF